MPVRVPAPLRFVVDMPLYIEHIPTLSTPRRSATAAIGKVVAMRGKLEPAGSDNDFPLNMIRADKPHNPIS